MHELIHFVLSLAHCLLMVPYVCLQNQPEDHEVEVEVEDDNDIDKDDNEDDKVCMQVSAHIVIRTSQ